MGIGPHSDSGAISHRLSSPDPMWRCTAFGDPTKSFVVVLPNCLRNQHHQQQNGHKEQATRIWEHGRGVVNDILQMP